jgi:hypothetical protein
MNKPTIYIIGTIFLLYLSSEALAADCNALLRLGYRNISESTGYEDQRTAQLRDFCSEKYDQASSSNKTQIEASYGLFSAGGAVTAENIRTTQDKVCDFSSNNSEGHRFKNDKSQTIYQGALDAWESCLKLQQKTLKISIDPTADLRAVTVQMLWPGAVPIEFQGVDIVDAGTASCIASVSGRKTFEATGDTSFKLNQKNVTLTCNRKLEPTGKNKDVFAKATRLTFKTEEGSFNVDLPPIYLTEIETKEISSILSELSKVKDQNIQLQTDVANLKNLRSSVECNSITGTASGHYPSAIATVPVDALLNGFVLVSGGCNVDKISSHNPAFLQSSKVGNSWVCRVGDPPNIPIDCTITATATFCRSIIK